MRIAKKVWDAHYVVQEHCKKTTPCSVCHAAAGDECSNGIHKERVWASWVAVSNALNAEEPLIKAVRQVVGR